MSRRFDVEVSLALGADLTADPTTWAWTDITSYAMVRDGGVKILRGRQSWQDPPRPSSCTVLLNNADGRFSRLNPTGTYYGQLTKNTPLRVRARPVAGSYSTRFVGYVSEWPTRWDPAEKHYWVPIQADGIMRRLGQGSSPIKSLSRSLVEYIAATFGTVTSYWPLEDDPGATSAAASLPDGTPMQVYGTVDFGGTTPPAGSLAAPTVSAGSLYGTATAASATGAWHIAFYVNCTGNCKAVSWATSGSMNWSVDISTTAVTVSNTAGGSASFSAVYTDGNWHTIVVTASELAPNVGFVVFGDGSTSASSSSAGTCGVITSVTVNPSFDADLVSVGHVSLGNAASSSVTDVFMNGDPGSSAINNFVGIGSYNDIFVVVSSAEGENMGTFPTGSVLEAFQACAAADEGQLVERANGRLALDTHQSRENLDVALALDYDLGDIGLPFEPTDDDRLTRNDVTVQMLDGSSARVVDQSGPLGVDNAGRYDEQVTRNLYTATQAYNHAGWRVNLGTVNEHRFPSVVLQLHRSSSLITPWVAADIGSRVTIDNIPTTPIPPDLVDQIIEGYTERINAFEWEVALNLSPYKPYKIFEIADDSGDTSEFVGRLAGDAKAATRTAITSSATSFDFDPNRYRWTTRLVQDGFGRTAASSWGSPDFGPSSWTVSGTSAAVFSVAGGFGLHTIGVVNDLQFSHTDTGYADHINSIDFTVPVLPTGAAITIAATCRVTDNSNYYRALLVIATSGATTLQIDSVVAGAASTIASATSVGTHSAGNTWRIVIQAWGSLIRARAWRPATDTDPGWQRSVTDTNLTGTRIGVRNRLESGNTNTLPVVISMDNVAVTSSEGSNVDDFPLDIRVGGEVITLSAIATTPVSFVNAGTTVHANNAAVNPGLYGSAAANDVIFVLVAVRSASAATLSTPTGYTRLPVWPSTANIQLYAKVHSGSESAPTITPTGGSAGDDISAFTFGLRGAPCSLTDLSDLVVDSAILSNSSAQNIAYPGLYPQLDGCFILVVGHKDDDWTSVAQLTGFTEMKDVSTATGNDQGLVVDYAIQGPYALVDTGSFVVTGGASAVSRSAVIAIAGGYQTATVSSRSVNGVVKAQSAATKMEAEDAFVLGL